MDLNTNNIEMHNNNNKSCEQGRWTREEHELFLQGMAIFGKNWKQVKETIETDLIINLSENSRRRQITEARSVYYKICYDKLNMSLSAIGKTVDRDHATVLHSINNVFSSLEYYNKDLYDYYLSVAGINNRVFKTKKRINNLNNIQLNQVNILIDELTSN